MIFVKTNFTPKNMIDVLKIAERDRNCLIGQKEFIHTSLSRARIRILPVLHTWSKSVFSLNMWKKVICILFCRLFFIAHLSKNNAFSQNVYSLF